MKSMIARQSPGAIVNVSSDSAFSAFPKNTSYGASKAALDMASRVMAIELGRHQVQTCHIMCSLQITYTRLWPLEFRSRMNEQYAYQEFRGCLTV